MTDSPSQTPTQPRVTGFHLVGSVPFADTPTVFRQCTTALPSRLKRHPDGETGPRHYFTVFQSGVFSAWPQMLIDFKLNASLPAKNPSLEEVDAVMKEIEEKGLDTGYDTIALESYATFCKLREEGVIPKSGVKFLVTLPSLLNVLIPFIEKPYQARVEPFYEEALFRAMRTIQEAIPHDDLAIQIDLAVDTAVWESVDRGHEKDTGLDWFQAYWEDGDIKQHCIDLVTRMIGQVAPDVEVGLHNCYGDMEHRHWYEPTSLKKLTERGTLLYESSPHPINFFHVPVPKSAKDNLDAYLAPLADMKPLFEKHGTEVIVGLVHEGEPELTAKMITAAGKVVSSFVASMECGGGRMNKEDFEDALRIAKEVTEPIM